MRIKTVTEPADRHIRGLGHMLGRAKFWIATIMLALAASTAVALYSSQEREAEPVALLALHQAIRLQHPEVRHLQVEDLKRLMGNEQEFVIFDVREAEEYAVSHIAGAIRVDPASQPAEFLTTHAPLVKGKTVVFYCSVGVRSSDYASKVQDALKQAGAVAVFNLQHGIFGWHNRRHMLTNGQGVTDAIHPFSEFYRPLLKHPEQAVL